MYCKFSNTCITIVCDFQKKRYCFVLRKKKHEQLWILLRLFIFYTKYTLITVMFNNLKYLSFSYQEYIGNNILSVKYFVNGFQNKKKISSGWKGNISMKKNNYEEEDFLMYTVDQVFFCLIFLPQVKTYNTISNLRNFRVK